MQIETGVRLTRWDVYSLTIACCVFLFFPCKAEFNRIFPEFRCLCSVRQIVTRGRSVVFGEMYEAIN